MNAATVYISKHSWRRFITRHGLPLPPCTLHELRRLLRIARREDLGSGATLRLLNNNLTPAVYYAADDWRFVLNEGEDVLMTVERIIYKKRPMTKPTRRRQY